jgi:eukaryotic-like serine/threonine-protein kinase
MSEAGSFDLGAYRLVTRIGRGGSAEVWHAHCSAGSFALKVLSNAPFQSAAVRALVEREVRVLAQLDHPNIVALHDHGEVTVTDAVPYAVGSPYLVMDLIRGPGALSCPNWLQLREWLVVLLDALAHAHSRGVLHLDIKPSNLLLAGSGALRLSDFGVARRRDDASAERAMLTPAYAAPEQITGVWREWGPCTDLYAMGGLAWALATGAPPMRRGSTQDTMRAQLHGALPEFRPRFPCPSGFEAWLGRNLQKSPYARFQTAAHARAALLELGLSTGSGQDEETDCYNAETLDVEALLPPPLQEPGVQRVVWASPLPARWRVRHQSPPRVPTLALWRCRVPRVVGRESEQSLLWEGLRGARDGKRVGVAVIGEAGVGKSRLASWLCDEAQESGSFEVLRPPGGGATRLLVDAVARTLSVEGLDHGGVRDAALGWVERHGGPAWLADDLAEWIRPVRRARCDGLGRTIATASAFVEMLAGLGPTLLWIDGLATDSVAAAVVHRLLEPTRPALPLMVVVCGRAVDERLPVLGVNLGPLAIDACGRMLQELLVIAPAAATALARRAMGNPRLALAILEDVAERGLLDGREDGSLNQLDPTVLTLPDSLHGVWQGRLSRLLAGRSEDDREALEVAALIARTPAELHARDRWVAMSVWQQACEAVGVRPKECLVSALVRQGAAERTSDGVRFAHGLLEESLVRSANDSGRAPTLHRAIASVTAGTASCGHHLLAGGLLAEALDPLLECARQAFHRGRRQEAACHLKALRCAAEGEPLGRDDVRWGELALFEACVARMSGQAKRAVAQLVQLCAEARANGWSELLRDAETQVADWFWGRGETERAVEMLRESALRAQGQNRWEAWMMLGTKLFWGGAIEEGMAATARSLEHEPQNLVERMWHRYAAGELLLAQDESHAAEQGAREGILWAREAGSLRDQGLFAWQVRAALERRGELDAALNWARRGRLLMARCSPRDVPVNDVIVAFLELATGRYAQAGDSLEGLDEVFRRRSDPIHEATVLLGQAVCATVVGRLDVASHLFLRAQPQLAARTVLGVARALELLGSLAEERGSELLAEAAHTLARAQRGRFEATRERARAFATQALTEPATGQGTAGPPSRQPGSSSGAETGL